MAGSFNHVVDKDRNLLDFEDILGISTKGESYETVEEMYGMIHWLADIFPVPKEAIDQARRNYMQGLKYAKGHNE